MRSRQALALAVAFAASAAVLAPAGAAEVCDKNCVGPACSTTCVREPDVTVGRDSRDSRDKVIIEERTRRSEPSVEIRERDRRPGVEVEVGR
jgi:hypothetical protein